MSLSLLLSPLALTACANTRLVPKTQVVVLRPDPALTERVVPELVVVRTNGDLERKAQRLESALAECNARLDDVRAAEEGVAPAQQDQPVVPWWRRIFGGGKR